MRSWVFSAGLIAPVWAKRTRPLDEDRCLRPGGQPDGQPPGGDVVDGPVLGVGCGGAVVDEPLVQGQLWEQPVLRRPAGACWRGLGAVICPAHGSCWSVGGLPVWLSAGWFMIAADLAGRLGCGRYCFGSGQGQRGRAGADPARQPLLLAVAR